MIGSGRCDSQSIVQSANGSEAKTKDAGTLFPMEADVFVPDQSDFGMCDKLGEACRLFLSLFTVALAPFF